MRMYGCLIPLCTNASWSQTASPEVASVFQIGYLCLWLSTQMPRWPFRINMNKLWLWHHCQNCSSHRLWHLTNWQLQLRSGLGLGLTLTCQQSLSLPLSKYTCNPTIPYSQPYATVAQATAISIPDSYDSLLASFPALNLTPLSLLPKKQPEEFTPELRKILLLPCLTPSKPPHLPQRKSPFKSLVSPIM